MAWNWEGYGRWGVPAPLLVNAGDAVSAGLSFKDILKEIGGVGKDVGLAYAGIVNAQAQADGVKLQREVLQHQAAIANRQIDLQQQAINPSSPGVSVLPWSGFRTPGAKTNMAGADTGMARGGGSTGVILLGAAALVGAYFIAKL